MEKKKKLIHRVGTFLCALVLVMSCVGVSCDIFYGATYLNEEKTDSLLSYCPTFENVESAIYPIQDYPEYDESVYPYYVILNTYNYGYPIVYMYSTEPFYVYAYTWTSSSGKLYHVLTLASDGECFAFGGKRGYVDGEFQDYIGGWNSVGSNMQLCQFNDSSDLTVYSTTNTYSHLVETNYPITSYYGRELHGANDKEVFDSDLGYLQNLRFERQYLRGAIFYNYDEDSLKYVWKHDLPTSSGLDLSDGNYSIRHYQKMATVKGYEKEDIIEMSDMYLMGEYEAKNGRFEYMQTDYDEKLEEFGYDGLGFVDKYLKGYFVLTHHYFQIVNNDTGEVGGYLHMYPKDSDGASIVESLGGNGNFGVENVFEGLDENFEVDTSAPSGYVEDNIGAGTTYEEAEQNANSESLGSLSGVDEFSSFIGSYASQVGNVSKSIGALFGIFPPWVLGLLGFGFAMLVLLGIIKVLRG